jgi:hypothetical protein
MDQVGYLPFDSRERSKGVGQELRQYPDPLSSGAGK